MKKIKDKKILKNFAIIFILLIISIIISLNNDKHNYIDKNNHSLYLGGNYNIYLHLNNQTKKDYCYKLNPNSSISSNNLRWGVYNKNKTAFKDIDIEKININKLRTILKGKKLSILGDSISTYIGYSNDSINTNNTIGNNKLYYKGTNYITDVNDTWWMRTSNETGLEILVNNSWSGDKVIQRGQKRCLELHDNTGDNAGTNPDIIAVYLGINDFRHNLIIK